MQSVIAIVDDDESLREALTSLLKSHGHEVVRYPTAGEFIASADRTRVGCLIADVNMPGMTGLQLHDRLLELGEPIPTIIITAYPKEQDRKRILDTEQCYLTKPFREEELLACVRSALDRSASKSS